ncbi:unnamed protein product [Albugo candida]|uniref:TFA2 Winged helix domain-containing protein n=1 Tax=Albugo candida TaxID=65357 RepID=A0A024FZ56_9STRA|nr:unnamed protein product [Albugo candida]|eukprot:CCI39791.1 unnamed protein product [Albugo candida]
MSWRNLAYGSKQVAESATTVIPIKEAPQIDISNVPKNDGAKVYNILEYLRKVPMHQPVSIKDIFQHTGVDLGVDDQVDHRLKNNPKVRVVGDRYAYQVSEIRHQEQNTIAENARPSTRFPTAFDSSSFENALLFQTPEGIPTEDLMDCYVDVERDLQALARSGEVICVKHAEKGAEVFYPRDMSFLVDVSGVATVEPGSYITNSSQDVTNEIRRGDAIKIGNHWFRVSGAVKTSSASRPAPFSGMSSKSVSSVRDPNTSKKVRYLFKFDKDHMPIDAPFPDASNNTAASMDRWDALPRRGPKFQMTKHGCTNDIRELWQNTMRNFPTDRNEFYKKLVQAGLTTQSKVDASRRQSKRRLKEDKKKTRTRKQRDIKISNQHLIGTELGEILAKGSEEQFTLGAVQFDKS